MAPDTEDEREWDDEGPERRKRAPAGCVYRSSVIASPSKPAPKRPWSWECDSRQSGYGLTRARIIADTWFAGSGDFYRDAFFAAVSACANTETFAAADKTAGDAQVENYDEGQYPEHRGSALQRGAGYKGNGCAIDGGLLRYAEGQASGEAFSSEAWHFRSIYWNSLVGNSSRYIV